MSKITIRSIEHLNEVIREKLDNYYKNHDAESFFAIDSLLIFCRDNGYNKDQVPALIEMKNVIVMG